MGSHLNLKQSNAAGQIVTGTYNPQGQMTSRTVMQSGTAETTTWSYSGGLLQTVTGPISSATTNYTYESLFRIHTVTDSQGYTLTYAYDPLNRITSITYPDGSTDQTIYNRRYVEWKKDRQNRWTHYLHDQLGRLVYVVDPAGNTIQYQYCPCGALTGIVDGNGNTTSFMQDVQSRVTNKVFADGSTMDYNYAPTTSRMQSVTDARNDTTTYSYNVDNALAGVSYSGTGTATPGVA